MAQTERKSILCPNCRRLINVDEPRCPYCDTPRPGAPWKNNPWTQALLNPEKLLMSVIYINVGMYLISIFLYPGSMDFAMNPLMFLSPPSKSLLLLGATGTYPIEALHRWWKLVSANFLHGGVLHIAFNMVALWNLGPIVLQEFGTHRFIIIYVLSGVAGFFASYLAGVNFTIGASAAIFGLVGAAMYYGKSRGGQYGTAIYKQLGGWAIALFIFGFIVPGINNWAHGGGLVAGAALGFVLGYHERQREHVIHKLVAGVCVVGTLGVLMYAVGYAVWFRFAVSA